MTRPSGFHIEILYLACLAVLWGSSYIFIKIAVAEIPPITLIAGRVSGAAFFLLIVLCVCRERLPTDVATWRMLGVQAFFNSIGAWTILAWGQQFVDAGLASVLNSTSPIFVFLYLTLVSRGSGFSALKLTGAVLGLIGVVFIVGTDTLRGLGRDVAGQAACLTGAALYAAAAIYGKRLSHVGVRASATGTMLWASLVLVPAALVVEGPAMQLPNLKAVLALLVLSFFCTGVALLIYFRLLRTLGSLGVASQSYLRAGVGVLLGVVVLGEKLTLPTAAGLIAAILGVALINWPGLDPLRRIWLAKSIE